MTTQDTEILDALTVPEHYNRTTVDGIHVDHIVDVLRAGVTLPPIRIDAATLEIIDGVHRWRALRFLHGGAASTPVIRETFDTLEDRFIASVEANASHGRALAPLDMKHCIQIAERVNFDLDRLRAALSVSPGRFDRYRGEFCYTQAGQKIPLPRSMVHLSGTIVSQGSLGAIRAADGSKMRMHARQLNTALGKGLIDWTDGSTHAMIYELHTTLCKIFPAVEAEDVA